MSIHRKLYSFTHTSVHHGWFSGITITSSHLLALVWLSLYPWKQSAPFSELNQWNLWIWHVFRIYFRTILPPLDFYAIIMLVLRPYRTVKRSIFMFEKQKRNVFYIRFIVLLVEWLCSNVLHVKYTISWTIHQEKKRTWKMRVKIKCGILYVDLTKFSIDGKWARNRMQCVHEDKKPFQL